MKNKEVGTTTEDDVIATTDPENPPTTETEVEQDKEQEVQTAGEPPKPNIIYIGENEPPTSMNSGMLKKIKIGDVDQQVEKVEDEKEKRGFRYKGKPFYHEQANVIIHTFSSLYKEFKQKGS
jgi:hypothetical protein